MRLNSSEGSSFRRILQINKYMTLESETFFCFLMTPFSEITRIRVDVIPSKNLIVHILTALIYHFNTCELKYIKNTR